MTVWEENTREVLIGYQPNARFGKSEIYQEKRHREMELEEEIRLRCGICHDDG